MTIGVEQSGLVAMIARRAEAQGIRSGGPVESPFATASRRVQFSTNPDILRSDLCLGASVGPRPTRRKSGRQGGSTVEIT